VRRLATIGLLSLAACGGEAPDADDASSANTMMDAPSGDVTAIPEGPTIPDDAPTLVFVGDSLGAGLHLAEHQAFPAVLQRRLVDEGLPFHLVNASVSGQTTKGGVDVVTFALRQRPELVVIELGGNDGLRGIPVEDTERNLRAMIEAARDAGAEVALLGVQLPENYGEHAERFEAIYPILALEYDLVFVPEFLAGVGAVPEMNLEDGLHPTPEGHEKLADNVIGAFRELLR
jgi:acyl-CoA thioesterase-1